MKPFTTALRPRAGSSAGKPWRKWRRGANEPSLSIHRWRASLTSGHRNGRNLAVAIDPSGRVHYGQDNVGGDHVVAVLGEQVSDAYLAELREDGASYIFAGPKGEDLPGAMAQLAHVFGVKKLLLEGGGRINGAFFKHRLIDEFSTLIFPAVDGMAGRETIVDYEGANGERPGAGQSLRLIGCETLEGGMVWLRHRVEEAPAPTPQG